MMTGTSRVDYAQNGELEQEIASNQLFGFWVYLMSDLVLFSALFAAFAVMMHSFAGAPSGKQLFNLPYVLGETVLLLSSSATCGLAMLAVPGGRRSSVVMGLAFTFLLGLGFIAMEINEFTRMVLDGNGPDRSGFLSAFFTLVGTHGSHVCFGLIWIAVIMVQAGMKGLTTQVRSRLVRLSMFWHFLDIVWIGVFTIVYLLGVS